jgi:MFS transporter, Spinster family, sphingosine-1-phosphate transporter
MSTGIPSDAAPPSPAADAPARGATLALSLLVLINLFNYIDRQVLAAVVPEISEHFFPGPKDDTGKPRKDATGEVVEPPPPLTVLGIPLGVNFLMGLLSTAFLVTYMLTAPVFGWLSTRVRRWLLVGLGVTIWSLASGASGLAGSAAFLTGFYLLLLTRCFVGIGEAAYGPVAPDMISDLYPVKKRGQVLAWFYAAIPVGSALGYTLGGQTIAVAGDWRVAFYLVVPPGLLMAVWCFLMPEPRRGLGLAAGAEKVAKKAGLAEYKLLLRTPSYALCTAGMTAMTFALGGLGYWVPKYLKSRDVETLFGVDAKTAFGGLTALSGLLATLAGGWLGDRLRARWSGSYFLVSGAAMLLAFPLLLLVIYLPFPLAWVPLVLCVFLLFFNTGPTNTILANVTHPLLRAPGFALNILIIHLLGDAISPPVMGAIKDVSSWAVAFQAVSLMVLVGGVLWLWGAKYLQHDTERAPFLLDAPAVPPGAAVLFEPAPPADKGEIREGEDRVQG